MKLSVVFTSLLLVGLFTIHTANAWWSTGHLLAAQIAFDDLTANNPSALAYATTTLNVLKGLTFENTIPFVESATWADDIKSLGLNAFDDWHFDDIPYFVDYTTTPPPEQENSAWSISQAMATLQKVNSKANQAQSGLTKSIMLRLLIHFVGDIHQPLHSTTMYSSQFKSGDRGGNSFAIKYSSAITNLHAFWDSVLGQYRTDISCPLSATDKTYISGLSASLRKEFTRASLSSLLAEKNTTNWVVQSHALAQPYVYTGITENSTPSTAYINNGFPIARKQLALGGYRIADLVTLFVSKLQANQAAADAAETEIENLAKGFLSEESA